MAEEQYGLQGGTAVLATDSGTTAPTGTADRATTGDRSRSASSKLLGRGASLDASGPKAAGRSVPRLVERAQWLGLAAALAHVWALPDHLDEWWGYGLFFLVAAAFQGVYSLVLDSFYRRDWFLALGIAGNLSLVLLWLLSRTAGNPRPGPHTGHVESVGIVDGATASLELALIGALGIAFWRLCTAASERTQPDHDHSPSIKGASYEARS